MARQFFGTDGIRGTVGQTPITPDFVLRLGHAVGRVLKRSHDKPLVLIGKDTRISGYMLEAALEAGLNSAGASVMLLGPLPTPGVAYLTRAQRAQLGVVISASHNPYPDNGIKFFSAQGTKLPDDWEEAVEAALQEPPQWVTAAELGKAQRLDDAAGRYIEFCKSTFASDLSLHGLKIVVDAAHGAAYHIAPKVFHELGAEVLSIGCQPNGLNINDHVGATHPEALALAVRANHADYGIALDKHLVVPGDYTFDDGFRGARRLLALREPPTAIFGSNDEIAAVIDYHVGAAFEDFFDVRVVFFRRCAVLCKYIESALYECRGNVVLS